jgi:ribonucleotide reductase beta subunit family protein with ferritin-like domain
VADRLLMSLGNDKVYNTANPFPWMDMISIQGKTNFFEKRVGDYQKAGVMAKREEQVFSMEADF